jgi:hypothetical protein
MKRIPIFDDGEPKALNLKKHNNSLHLQQFKPNILKLHDHAKKTSIFLVAI